MRFEGHSDRVGHGGDIAGIVVVAHGHSHLREAAPRSERTGHGIEHRRGGHRGVLGEERQHQEPPDTGRAQGLQGRSDRGLSVAHPQDHLDTIPEAGRQPPFQPRRLALGVDQQRRALLVPDPSIGACGVARPKAQDDPVEQGQPQPSWQLDDPRVREELPEEVPHGARCRRRGGPEVGQEDPQGRFFAAPRRGGDVHGDRRPCGPGSVARSIRPPSRIMWRAQWAASVSSWVTSIKVVP